MKTSDILLVGYTARPREDAELFIPDFQANKGTKDAELREKQIEMKRLSFMADMATKPYVGELERVCLVLVDEENATESKCIELDRDELGQPLSDVVANTLKSWFKGRFDTDGNYTGMPVRPLGFDIRTFVKMLSLECAESGNNILPHSLWYNAEYRDVKNMVLPSPECDGLNLDVVISRLGIAMPEKMVYEPGDDATLDVMVTAAIVRRLNLFPRLNTALDHVASTLLKKQTSHMAQCGLSAATDNLRETLPTSTAVAAPAAKRKVAKKAAAK